MVDSKIVLVVAVVIVIIAALAYFYVIGRSGSGVLTIGGTGEAGAICVVKSGTMCTNASVNSNGTISFEFRQISGGPMFNLAFACTTQETSSGAPDTSANPFIHIGNSTLASGAKESIVGLPCYGPNGKQSAGLTSAYLWISYSGSVNGVSMTMQIGTLLKK